MISTQREKGQGLAEYAFILSLVVLVVLVVLVILSGGVENLFQNTIPPIVDAIRNVFT